MDESETTLRMLLRSLKVCLNVSRERARRIVSLELEDFLSAEDDPESESARASAEEAFEDELSQAQHALFWRALVVAHRVGQAMWEYIRSPSGFVLGDPWMDWRRSVSEEPCVTFVQSLTDEEFFCVRLAYHVHRVLNFRDLPGSVPSDGDIEDVPAFLESTAAFAWPQWFELLGEPPRDIAYGYLLHLAETAALREIGEAGDRKEFSVSDLEDRIESIAALQVPMLDTVAALVTRFDSLGPPSRFKTEESLKDALGDKVYSRLSADARDVLLDAEHRYRDSEIRDWNSVVADVAKAFALQLRQRFLPRLADYLKDRGISRFPDGDMLPRGALITPIIEGGKAVERSGLGTISIALGLSKPVIQEFARTRSIDLLALKRQIDGVRRYRNPGAHETGMSSAQASELREKWLGVASHDGGIFGIFCRD